jgi:hypothetical protein
MRNRDNSLMFEPRGTARPSGYGIRKRGRKVYRHDIDRLELALISLRDCVRYTRNAGAHHTAARVRAALKSAQGAYNHARAMLARQERAK